MKVFFSLQQNDVFLPGHGKSHLCAPVWKEPLCGACPRSPQVCAVDGVLILFTQGQHSSPVLMVLGRIAVEGQWGRFINIGWFARSIRPCF